MCGIRVLCGTGGTVNSGSAFGRGSGSGGNDGPLSSSPRLVTLPSSAVVWLEEPDVKALNVATVMSEERDPVKTWADVVCDAGE